MAARLWLLEGLPGTGKTTAAERLCELCNSAGLPARWWLEEAKDHPVTPAELRRRAAETDFADLCVSAFHGFVRREAGVLILEGSSFQSTVRFMFADGWPVERIQDYLNRLSITISPACPRLLVFRAVDVRRHFADFVAPVRGPEWVRKLVAYVERTPIATANSWSSFDGLVRFWADYQHLVLELASELNCPLQVIDGWSGGGQSEAPEVLPFFRG